MSECSAILEIMAIRTYPIIKSLAYIERECGYDFKKRCIGFNVMKEFVNYLDDNYKDDNTEYYKEKIDFLIFDQRIRSANGKFLDSFASRDTIGYFNTFIKSNIESVRTPEFDNKFNQKFPKYQNGDFFERNYYYKVYQQLKLNYVRTQSLEYLKIAKRFIDEKYVNNTNEVRKK